MDDMNALRDLGRELEHEPPASLARQRNRLLAVQKKRWFAKPQGWALIGAASVVTAAAVIVPFAFANQPIRNAALELSGERPTPNTDAMNILIIGSDSREGANAKYGKPVGPARSDTTMLVHLPKDRKNVTVVSFPRDAMVQIPKCESTPAQLGLLNLAYSHGGVACTWKMIEQLTGLRVDHAVEINFTGLRRMVNALGGVPVTLPHAVNDPLSKLNLAKGEHVLSGEQALAYVRTRHALGDGSDLDRIKRQQQFMASMVKKASQLLGNPIRLVKFLSAATRGFKVDKGLSMSKLMSIAASFDDQSKTTFVTVPWQPYPQDPNRIQLKQPAATRLFKGLISELVLLKGRVSNRGGTMGAWVIWLAFAGVLVGAELLTLTLDFVLVAIAALVAALVAMTGLSVPFQLLAFIITAIGTLGVVRPLARKHVRMPPVRRFGTDALIGREATALSEISRSKGLVRIGGEEWTARPYDPDIVIAEGAAVDVLAIEGVTALVYPREI